MGSGEQPDITFRAFAETYITTYAELHKRSVDRDREIVKVLNRAFGSLILHEITAFRIEQFKRERLAGKWRGLQAHGPGEGDQAGHREPRTRHAAEHLLEGRGVADNCSIIRWASVKRLTVDNRRTRTLTEAEQAALLEASPKRLGRLVTLALMTGARVGELLALRWEDVSRGGIDVPRDEKRHHPAPDDQPGDGGHAVAKIPRSSPWVFANPRTHDRYTVNGMAHTFRRAVERAGITTGDVTLHTLRHTAIEPDDRARAIDDHTVKGISGHKSTRMLERYTHPTDERKLGALRVSRPDGQEVGRTGR